MTIEDFLADDERELLEEHRAWLFRDYDGSPPSLDHFCIQLALSSARISRDIGLCRGE